MIVPGIYQTLEVARKTVNGLYLCDKEGNEVLLPNKYVPVNCETGDTVRVFVYHDSDERPVATTLQPLITLDAFARLKVKEISKPGAFLDWGLEKDLLLPFSEQTEEVRAGRSYLVRMYTDRESGRLVATQKIRRFLNNDDLDLKEGQEVDIICASHTPLGAVVIVNGRYEGLVYSEEMYTDFRPGDTRKAWVRKIREDKKLDIALQQPGYGHVEPNARIVLDALKKAGGRLNLHDGSPPEDIYEALGMSKKTFKKAIGLLYRQRIIQLDDTGMSLI